MCIYASAIGILAKGYLPNTLITPVKLKEMLNEVRKTLQVTNPEYDLVIDRLHLYYDMQLVTLALIKINISLFNSQCSYSHIHNNP